MRGLHERLAQVRTGISIGKPPACQTPRFTSSARMRKCAWQGFASLQVLRIAMTGLPWKSSALKPACLARERWPNDAQVVLAEPAVAAQLLGRLAPLRVHAGIIQDAARDAAAG